MRRNAWTDWFIILGFLASIGVPGILMEFPSTASRSGGGMMLTNPAETSHSSSKDTWRTDTDRWVSEHFGFRNGLVTVFNRLSVKVGISPNPEIILGHNNWLYLGSPKILEDYAGQRLFTDAELQQWKRYMTIKYHALKDLGIGYIFVVAPNKIDIEQANLPDRYRAVQSQDSRTAQWIAFMQRETDVPIVDVRDVLRRRSAIMPVYQSTDTHWTEYGADIVTSAVFNRLSDQGLGKHHFLPGKGDYEMQLRESGDLARMLHLQDCYQVVEPKDRQINPNPARKTRTVPNTLFARQETFYETSDETDRLMVMGDSFVYNLKPIMSLHFEKTLVLRLHNHQMRHLDPVVHYVHAFRPDYVVEVRVGRYLLDTVPEDPPRINLDSYPDWLKKFFVLRTVL